jgi:hypothetical protein
MLAVVVHLIILVNHFARDKKNSQNIRVASMCTACWVQLNLSNDTIMQHKNGHWSLNAQLLPVVRVNHEFLPLPLWGY